MQNKEQLKVMMEPYVEPVMHSMPFNLTEFAGRYNLSMPDMFQSEESPRPGLELAKQVGLATTSIGPSQHACKPLVIMPSLDRPKGNKEEPRIKGGTLCTASVLSRHACDMSPPVLTVQGFKPKHPIIIVPGFVTSGLELWHGKPCAAKYFRCTAVSLPGL